MSLSTQSVRNFIEYIPAVHEEVERDATGKAALHHGFADGFNAAHFLGPSVNATEIIKHVIDNKPVDPLACKLKELRPLEYSLGVPLGIYAHREGLVR